jgi:hypothetical protein
VEHGGEPRALGSNSTVPGGLVYRVIADSDIAAGIRDALEELESPEIPNQSITSWLAKGSERQFGA